MQLRRELTGVLPTYQNEHPHEQHPAALREPSAQRNQLRLQPLCSAEPSPRSSPGQGSGLSAPKVPAPTPGIAVGSTQQLLQAPHLLLLHNPGTRMSLENKQRITCKSWKLILFYVLGKHCVFHTIFKHKMFISLFNLYNFLGLLVPLTLSVYKGWTIQAIAT